MCFKGVSFAVYVILRGIIFVAEVGRGGEYDTTTAFLNSIAWRSCVTVYKLRELALLYRIIITVLGVPSLNLGTIRQWRSISSLLLSDATSRRPRVDLGMTTW